MKETPDYILEQALARLASGESAASIAASFSNYPGLTEELQIAALLQSVPIARVPAPSMRYRYTEKVGFWRKLVNSIQTYRFAAVPLVLMLLLMGGTGILQAANNSLPGDRLYGMKIAAEQAQLKLTFNEEKQATLYVELAKKRLDEARRVIALSNPDQEAIALDNLAKQTERTFEFASHLAATKAVAQNDTSLLENLVAFNKEKRLVLATAVKSADDKTLAQTTINTKANDKNLARLIAAVNEQSLLDLPNKISVTGIVSTTSNKSITVENNIFTINDATIILSQEGDPIDEDMGLTGQITVIGTRQDNTLVAKKIVIIDPEAVLPTEQQTATKNPTVSGATTPPPATSSTTQSPATAATTTQPIGETTDAQKPSEATAGFIVEPSAKQYPQ